MCLKANTVIFSHERMKEWRGKDGWCINDNTSYLKVVRFFLNLIFRLYSQLQFHTEHFAACLLSSHNLLFPREADRFQCHINYSYDHLVRLDPLQFNDMVTLLLKNIFGGQTKIGMR